MYIKSIKIQGFKSFADKMEFDLDSKINAIVGPNGSGKSNVVDALLWAIGEQSVKQLRGDSAMSDIIFSGSSTREEMKKASVAILFDNTDHMLNSEFNEVEIKRVIYKSGENEYYINNSRVRLKDISDLLIDVTSKFNIITQGNIAGLVENRSSERRILFESAAGVLKYKKRKEEALKKLDNTNENISKVNLIIKELLVTLEPLKKQKDDAKKYLQIKKDLENIEISLLAFDIESANKNFSKLKNENELLTKKLNQMRLTHPIDLEALKLQNVKLEEEIANTNERIVALTKEIGDLNTQKELSVERAKYNLDEKTLNENLIALKEEESSLKRSVNLYSNELNQLKEDIISLTRSIKENSDYELKSKLKITACNNDINNINKDILLLQNKINIEKSNLENGSFLPKSVSSVINNPRLLGIHNTIGNLIEVQNDFELAINVALGASSNFIICDNLDKAKEAINYLKSSHLGRATFFPIDTIKSRKLENSFIKELNLNRGFVGIASDLISYNDIYKNIMENQLGNTIVMDNIDNLFILAKKLDYKYKMVTLDGEIIFPGGSLAGGNSEKNNSSKQKLNEYQKMLSDKENDLKNANYAYDKENETYQTLVDSSSELGKKLAIKKADYDNKELLLKEYQEKLEKCINDLVSLTNNSEKNDNLIEQLLDKINEKMLSKDTLESTLKEYQNAKSDLTLTISEKEKEIKEQNSLYHKTESEINHNEIEIGKYEVRIDNLLNILSNDYNMTFEYANNNYSLELDEDLARSKVNSLKNELKKLDNINLGSISEYDRISARYNFLENQKNDLEKSSTELLNIISEMDEIMKTKFKETFDKISKEFSIVFRTMFKGGNGILKLDDENDLLNTGINIMAVPPGKKLNSTAFLSGGEKSLTAICLIFAILNVKPVPFIVLDEAEAALDEENVSMFGKYLEGMKQKSQFILITHKKKMMEYADTLYGITMQESGVSKLVSVKLEEK